MKTYSELVQLKTFVERFEYLVLHGAVGAITFGHERWMNQRFYRSKEWATVRNHVIARDLGCDLGLEDHPIQRRIHVHHMNPMLAKDLKQGRPEIADPEFLITVSIDTHNAIHYGAQAPAQLVIVERFPGDTTLW